MDFKKFKIKQYPGEKALKRCFGVVTGVASSAGSAMAWYSSLGTVTKIGLTLGLVNPPMAGFIAAGLGGTAIGIGFSRNQLIKREKLRQENFLTNKKGSNFQLRYIQITH